MTFCFFSVSIIHKGELRWNIYHKPQNQDKVTELNTEGAEGNLDPSLQFCYFLPWIWVPACVCVDSAGARLCSGGGSGWAQKEFEPELSMSTDLRRCPQLVPVWAAPYRWISWPEWIAGRVTFLLSQAAAGCSVLSWKNGHLNLRQLKWELSPMVQQWQASKCKTAQVFLSKAPEIVGYVPCCSWFSRITKSPEEPGHNEHAWEGLRSWFSEIPG